MDWAISISEPREWNFIGAIGTEDRSLSALRWVKDLGLVRSISMVQVDPMLGTRYFLKTQDRLVERMRQFRLLCAENSDVYQIELLAELHEIQAISDTLAKKGSSIILDISSLPKRFFFPMLRTLIKEVEVRDLILTYGCPRSYLDGAKLSEGAGKWDYLPGFLGKEFRSDVLVASVGFMVESLQDYLSSAEAHPAVQLLIPFPSSPTSVRRAWESIISLQSNRSGDKFVKHRIDANDMSMAFDRICSLSRSVESVAFAPFGPKPISAAMCLYAVQCESAVHYPQPESYHPDYSVGVASVSGKPFVNGYWIKHDGINLYSV
ncbi:hypothetical protein [Phragmitibacter flavus]|uniref:hypothetical protein n=1 Tax=Phragmitibacter flavus TaxID=2576071 RepID=UPI00197F7D39|nr:hypothetical protein [Phragmitibacter flavus]